jgi:hypothetical protein
VSLKLLAKSGFRLRAKFSKEGRAMIAALLLGREGRKDETRLPANWFSEVWNNFSLRECLFMESPSGMFSTSW